MADQPNIAFRAYELWDAAGRPEGRSEEFYFKAEEELRMLLENELAHDTTDNSPPAVDADVDHRLGRPTTVHEGIRRMSIFERVSPDQNKIDISESKQDAQGASSSR